MGTKVVVKNGKLALRGNDVLIFGAGDAVPPDNQVFLTTRFRFTDSPVLNFSLRNGFDLMDFANDSVSAQLVGYKDGASSILMPTNITGIDIDDVEAQLYDYLNGEITSKTDGVQRYAANTPAFLSLNVVSGVGSSSLAYEFVPATGSLVIPYIGPAIDLEASVNVSEGPLSVGIILGAGFELFDFADDRLSVTVGNTGLNDITGLTIGELESTASQAVTAELASIDSGVQRYTAGENVMVTATIISGGVGVNKFTSFNAAYMPAMMPVICDPLIIPPAPPAVPQMAGFDIVTDFDTADANSDGKVYPADWPFDPAWFAVADVGNVGYLDRTAWDNYAAMMTAGNANRTEVYFLSEETSKTLPAAVALRDGTAYVMPPYSHYDASEYVTEPFTYGKYNLGGKIGIRDTDLPAWVSSFKSNQLPKVGFYTLLKNGQPAQFVEVPFTYTYAVESDGTANCYSCNETGSHFHWYDADPGIGHILGVIIVTMTRAAFNIDFAA